MKTITLETSKRLAPYLEEVETEYFYSIDITHGELIGIYKNDTRGGMFEEYINTLTLEEAIEFLPSGTRIIIDIQNDGLKQYIGNNIEGKFNNINFQYDSLLELIENMIIYLLDNELLK